MTSQTISFYSEGVRLAGDLFLPEDLQRGEVRAGIVLCHGYTGVRNLYLPDIARVLTGAGYAVLTFDYKGWGDSEGPRSRLSPYGRVINFPGGADVAGGAADGGCGAAGHLWHQLRRCDGIWVGAVDPRVKCVVSVVGIGNGRAGCAACAGPTNSTICSAGPPPIACDA